ncbi:DNA polymerase zeta catalytic subunit-like isoform X2 [Abrus precatorius]|uniref:DNA polymerase n=1 Tax=Abrus precatorius TaxID=3816 RepID=A0A8B8L1F3_ABRPR|nr:DNA polymerase zeta catalytic subunit-like isoform X2 [Abrus precatorius]
MIIFRPKWACPIPNKKLSVREKPLKLKTCPNYLAPKSFLHFQLLSSLTPHSPNAFCKKRGKNKMTDSRSNSEIFSVRIVSIDYHMAPPIPGTDICYSSFHGEKVNEVPVIRVYGSTPAGQKTCLHIHRALPYLYVPCSDIPLLPDQGDAYTYNVAASLEKALKLKGSAGSTRQHVHGCSLVRAKKFYGYHSFEDLFVKIYLYYPQDVSRAANLLLAGAVLDKSLQPYESHIPFILQFLVDYNLYGMGHLHLSNLKFRHPIPTCKKLNIDSQHRKADPGADACLESKLWMSSVIPSDWMWPPPSDFGASSNDNAHCPKRQSICELEGDTSVNEILNQQFKMYSSLSQTCSDVYMVQSLVPIWEEQQKRTGIHKATMPSDPGKPLPEDVMKLLSVGFDFERKLIHMCSEAETSFFCTPEKELRETDIIGSASPPASLCENAKFHEEGTDLNPKLLTLGEMQSSEIIGMLDIKAADKEAQNLLKWLATSQAAEDINSDDELAYEMILTPLVPSATIHKVLEEANMAYESESQKECQDILDSIDDMLELELAKEKPSSSFDHNSPIKASSNSMLPQVDGSNDDEFSSPHASLAGTSSSLTGTSSPLEISSEYKRGSEYHVLHNTDTSTLSKDKRNKQWGSLPFSMTDKVNKDGEHVTLLATHPFGSATGDSAHSDYLNRNEVRNSAYIKRNMDKGASDSKEVYRLVNCSLRDMMRRKRSYQVEQTECEAETTKKLLLDRHEEPNRCLQQKQLDLKTKQTDEEETELQKNCDLIVSDHDNLMCNKLPLPAGSGSFLQASKPKDECFGQHEMQGLEASMVLRNCTNEGSSLMHGGPDLHEPEKYFIDSTDQSVTCRGEDLRVCAAFTKPASPHPFLDTQLITGADYKVRVPERSHQTESSTSCSVQSSFINDKVSGKYNCMDQSSYGSISFVRDDQVKFCENSVGKSAASDVQVLLSKKMDNPKLGEKLLCETVGSEPTDLKGNPMKFFEITTGDDRLADKNLESNLSLPIKTLTSKGTKGVTTHYQNDGSYLYLLTPNILPPSAVTVHRWLFCEEKGHVPDQMHQETDAEDKDIPKCASEPPLRQKLYQDADTEKKLPCIGEEQTERAKAWLDGSQDISQISGPDGKSGLTPLSQIGFRDPASVGCGQQLTLLSTEILAESRGDLLPDPQFDGINIVALGFQNDSDSIVEVLVLLHSKSVPSQRSFDGLSGCKMLVFTDEKHMLKEFIKIVSSSDPDILMGWDIQGSSLGFLAERASHLGLGLLNNLSRTPSESWIASKDTKASEKDTLGLDIHDSPTLDCYMQENSIIEDEWGRTHASGVHVGGRIVLNMWRLIRGEVKLNLYTVEAVAEAVLRRKIPSFHHKVLAKWFSSGPGRARYQCIKYVIERAKLNLEILNQLDMVNRTAELARVFGIDFFSVLSRGSQYRVESMFLRLAHSQNYLAISPGNQQVASQPAMECLPLVMEPESGFYSDPVVVLDFQSLYPSMIIAYNLCFCTCLGKVVPPKANTLGVSSFSPEQHVLQGLKDQILLTPNGVMFVPSKVRRGVLPRLLEEILTTRIMVKQAIKKLAPSEQILQRIYNARQLALKLISNVTYGYTAAGFSGRMPCAELADSIVQCGRSTLENAISFVNLQEKWNAKVIYGDTDSMFVLLKGRTIKESFQIGSEIASAITAMNPSPVTLKMEKVYHPCFLLTKKRYVGYSYERPDQIEPGFDAKGIETVRRDTCGAVAKIMEQSLRLYFEHQDLLEVKAYLQRQWKRILSGRFSLKDFIFAKEVRLGTYSARISSLPPAAIVATKAMRVDPRAEPRYAERVPYVVIHGEPGARLVDMVVDPSEVLAIDSPFRINDLYYINKQIIPALQRVFGLIGADLNQWFSDMPRSIREASTKHTFNPNIHRTRIDYYYLSKHCVLCGGLVQASAHLCNQCSENEVASAAAVIGKTSKLEQEMQHLVAICHHCGGGDRLLENAVKCTSISCLVFYERRKVQKELLAATHIAAELYISSLP